MMDRLQFASGDEQYPTQFIESCSAIIIEEKEDNLSIGITENTTEDTLNTLRNYHKKKITFIKLNQMEISSWLAENSSEHPGNIPHKKEKDAINKIEENASIVNLVNSIIMEGIEKNASDIHIEADEDFYIIRYRIDGSLSTYNRFSNNKFWEISTRIKVMANLNILEKRLPQDGRITINYNEEKIDLRVSIIPLTAGESIVLRILGNSKYSNNTFSLKTLGFSKETYSNIMQMLKIQHGLVLVTGPTGSGKTTTLNAMLREIVNDEIKIVSIEDPVEMKIEGVNQIQINEQIEFTFDSVLRRVLRQDPDVIMVGEIRDSVTAKLCARAALTGHLVLSTLHTNDSIGTITRLINMGIEPYLVASILKGAIAQRLVKAKDENTRGRTIIDESFMMTKKLEELINNDSNEETINNYLIKNGMKFLRDDALDKIKKGLTTKSAVEKEISLII